jgi:serine/threonine-protein kinase
MLAVRDSDGLAVAIKHLFEALRQDERFVTRFRAEAGVIREIDSPHTARVLDYVEAGGDAAIVMELVDGVTLRRLIQHEGGTGVEAALAVLKGALLGLAEAHRRGVVHRDFKPENVIVTQDGDSKLVDFGVAARSGENAALVGTPLYMAPEQWDDAPATPASDVYAAALVFFECLTGHRPFTAENLAALAFQHQHMPPPVEDVDEPLRALVGHGLAKDPADRPASAEAFLAELEEVAREVYGVGWELRGRTGLGLLTVPFSALLPMAKSGAESGNATTSMAHSTVAPVTKVAVTSGLVLATAAAVVSAFVLWHDPPTSPESGVALPPARSGTPFSTGPASPATPGPSLSGTIPPSVPFSAGPSGYPSAYPSTPPGDLPTTGGPPPATPPATEPATRPATQPATRPATRPPATSRPPDGSHPPASTAPATKPPATQPATTKPATTKPPATQPPATTRPPATTSAPTTKAPDTPPPATTKKPLLSISIGVSLGGPLLGGDGDGLLDADIGVGLGSSLLGLVVVPGSVLLGRQIVARRVRRPREPEKP